MGHGGKRRGAGRPKGGVTQKVRARALADDIVATGRSPLSYMIAIMEDVTADPQRRDEMAKAAAVYCHPRLSAITTSNTYYKGDGSDPSIVQILSVPRGVRLDIRDGSIATIDGEATELQPVEPYAGTPALLTDATQAGPPERLPVVELDTSNVTVLRRRDEDLA